MIGRTFAHYEITELLGKGGMGEVYRAHDGKLDRDVALKLLPPDLASDPERLARFRREAKLLAALNHPNIAAIHGLEQDEGRHFLVMELAEGEDLATRLRRGAVPLEEALDISRQIAEGLEEAHEKGIVHRDLKPGNLRISADGKVKVLDFGLARAYLGEAVDEQDLHHSPTITAAMTQQGVILGTAAYMSPEQAKGKTVDRRADLWSFGVILWEMLSGRRLFEGETVSDTLAAVLRADPPFEELPQDTPPAVRRLLERCLERDPRKRLRDIGEARIRLQRWQDDPSTLVQSDLSGPIAVQRGWAERVRLPWAVALVAVLAAAGIWWWRGGTEGGSIPTLRLEFRLEEQRQLQENFATNVILSPDGRLIAYLAGNRIRLRRLDQLGERILDGTQDARIACFSPDGKWIAFTAGGKLHRISVTGGSPVEICDAPDSRGICWVNETTLVLNATFASALQVVSLTDGIARPLTELDEGAGERSHRWPSPLPDGKSVLFLCQYFGRDYDEGDIMVVDLESGDRHVVYRGGASPRYSASGHLLFTRANTVFAIPFDYESGETSGVAVPVVDQVWTSVGDQEACDGSAQFDLCSAGLLVYRSALDERLRTQPAWVDLATGEVERFGDVDRYTFPVLSPDARRLALMRGSLDDPDIYIYDIEEGVMNRLTFGEGSNVMGCWSTDSREIFFTRPTREGVYIVYRKPADGSGVEEEVTRRANTVNADAETPDGKKLYLTVWNGADMWDIHVLDLENPGAESKPVVTGPGMQYFATVSPDGRWLVHVQDRRESWSLYVRPIPDTGARWEVMQSSSQLQHATWSADGRSIFTRNQRGTLRIDLEFEGDGVRARPPRLLREDEGIHLISYPSSDTFPDGTRAVVLLPEQGSEVGSSASASLFLVTNWFEELERKVSAQ